MDWLNWTVWIVLVLVGGMLLAVMRVAWEHYTPARVLWRMGLALAALCLVIGLIWPDGVAPPT